MCRDGIRVSPVSAHLSQSRGPDQNVDGNEIADDMLRWSVSRLSGRYPPPGSLRDGDFPRSVRRTLERMKRFAKLEADKPEALYLALYFVTVAEGRARSDWVGRLSWRRRGRPVEGTTAVTSFGEVTVFVPFLFGCKRKGMGTSCAKQPCGWACDEVRVSPFCRK